MKILYLYSGTRKDKWRGTPGVDFPDTQLYGLNHLYMFGVTAEHKELSDFLLEWVTRIVPFRLRHFLLYFVTQKYNVVFGPSLLYSMILQKIFRYKTKFVLLNISLSRTLIANRHKNARFAILKSFSKEFSGIVCLSDTQKNFLGEQFPFLKDRIHTVPLGVDVAYHKPIYTERSGYILSVGRDNGRDYKTVIETARLMPERIFVIVCSKRNLVGISDIPRNVNIHIDIAPEELYKKYREARTLLIITHGDKYEDGSDCSGQTVLLEGMANGMTIIATRKEYITEYVNDGKEALLVNPYNAKEITEKIEMLDSDILRDNLSKNARTRAKRDFSTEKMAESLAEVFKKINAV